jgi:RNA polymerase sigma-70 factor, ECF subfamily
MRQESVNRKLPVMQVLWPLHCYGWPLPGYTEDTTKSIGAMDEIDPLFRTGAAETSPNSSDSACVADEFDPETIASSRFARQLEDQVPYLHRMVRRWYRDKADADDLVQDTLLRALANAHLWLPGSDLRAWLFTIMRNQFRANMVRASRSASLLRQFALDDYGAADDRPEARLVLRDVEGALRRLPKKQRTAVMLAGLEGKSYVEVAETMGLSVGSVRCHLARGRNRLRAVLHGGVDRSPFAPRPARSASGAAISPEAPALATANDA